jgi:TolB-like protein/class 3 adenylate cyclase/Tfp pilus assembly protein PilF
VSEEGVERRLTTILAADVVGYSRLMAADEAGTLTSLKAIRRELIEPKTTEHHGRVVKLIGDGTLMEFGSVVDAVRFAVDVQQAIAERNAKVLEDRRITYRMGINIGDIIVEGDDIYGDGVNVAARLEGLAEPGGICLSDMVHQNVKAKLDLAFEDLGEQQVKNIPEPVRVFKVLLDAPVAEHTAALAPAAKRSLRWPIAAGSLIVLVIVAGAILWQRPWEVREEPASVENMAFPLPDKPSIAVLPFANMSGDPEQEYFADGMAEDLITDLSKISGLFVIARNSSFSYKGQQVKVRQVAEELGVRYVLEGSVRRAGDEVRINAQLIDATTGGHIWAERYDGTLADVFDLQDKVTGDIVAALSLVLSPDQAQAREGVETRSPEAYDLFLKGWEHYRKRTLDHYAKAMTFFQEAVELDPDFSRAHAAMASIYWDSAYDEWSVVLGIGRDKAKELARASLESALRHPTPLAHQVASEIFIRDWEHDKAIEEAKRSLAINPNDADGNYALAGALIMAGRPEDAADLLEQARRLDPLSQDYYAFANGIAQFGRDNFAAAAASFERAIELNPDYWEPDPSDGFCKVCELLLSAYGYLGRMDDAKIMLEKVYTYWPQFNVNSMLYWWPYKQPEDRDRLANGLRKAGVPDFK